MAVVSEVRAKLATPLGPAVLAYTFDDVTLALTSITLDTPVRALVSIRRGNGANWWRGELTPGRHVQNTGGPVRNLVDIPDFELSVRTHPTACGKSKAMDQGSSVQRYVFQRPPALNRGLVGTPSPLDDLVGAPEVGDPRIRLKPHAVHGRTVLPLTQQPGGLQAWKIIIPTSKSVPELKTHPGHEWMYVLSGQLRLILGDHDIVMGPGEVAEFDTRVPHWFGSTGTQPAKILSLRGERAQRMHIRAQPRRRGADE